MHGIAFVLFFVVGMPAVGLAIALFPLLKRHPKPLPRSQARFVQGPDGVEDMGYR